ncbi:hypothetical protein [Spirosoma harenae]
MGTNKSPERFFSRDTLLDTQAINKLLNYCMKVEKQEPTPTLDELMENKKK